jgi:hypothetical protein
LRRSVWRAQNQRHEKQDKPNDRQQFNGVSDAAATICIALQKNRFGQASHGLVRD